MARYSAETSAKASVSAESRFRAFRSFTINELPTLFSHVWRSISENYLEMTIRCFNFLSNHVENHLSFIMLSSWIQHTYLSKFARIFFINAVSECMSYCKKIVIKKTFSCFRTPSDGLSNASNW